MGRRCKDYTGQIHGCWEVIERDWEPISSSHETFWICKCSNCGNIVSVRKTDLDKNPVSCNQCKQRIRGNVSWEIGDRYGKLTIVGPAAQRSHKTYVTVQCDCGSDPFEVKLEHLKGQGGHSATISCGCINESSGEYTIRKYLEQTDLNFQTQYRVKDDNNKVMIFDFVILNDNNQIIKCIEYNGKQHYEPVEYFGGKDAYQNQQERDRRKADYCKQHGIQLIWIPYYEYDNINAILNSVL